MEEKTKVLRPVVLSKRLSCVAQMVSPGGTVCDVGCDHGFVAIYLIQKGIADRVLAMDVREGPLSRAQEHVWEYGLCDYIEVRLSDGLSAVSHKESIGTVIMAGMGGLLMTRLIDDALQRDIVMPELVLQPQSHWQQLRCFLRQQCYKIVQEDMICEEGKYYPVLRAIRIEERREASKEVLVAEGRSGAMREQGDPKRAGLQREVADLFGPLLLQEKNDVLLHYLLREQDKFSLVRARIAENGKMDEAVEKQLAMIHEALAHYESS